MGTSLTATHSVLIVDDEPSLRNMLVAWLSRSGWKCVTAADPTEALQLLEHEPFTHAIVDLQLGAHSGLDLIQTIHSRWPSVRIVAMTGSMMRAEAALGAGAVAFLRKPFNSLDEVAHSLSGSGPDAAS